MDATGAPFSGVRSDVRGGADDARGRLLSRRCCACGEARAGADLAVGWSARKLIQLPEDPLPRDPCPPRGRPRGQGAEGAGALWVWVP
eukprot:scaffold771_cov387-Prasinococcus_capsulatus_cf.AAC.9